MEKARNPGTKKPASALGLGGMVGQGTTLLNYLYLTAKLPQLQHYKFISVADYSGLDCVEQQSIAEEIGVSEATISGWFKKRKTSQTEAPASRQHFDIWNFTTADQEAGGQQSYFGALPPQVIENLAIQKPANGCSADGYRTQNAPLTE